MRADGANSVLRSCLPYDPHSCQSILPTADCILDVISGFVVVGNTNTPPEYQYSFWLGYRRPS